MAFAHDGLPLIAFQSMAELGGSGGVAVAKCGSPTCARDTVYTVIDTKPQTGLFTDIAVGPAGDPVVSYHDYVNHDLFVARCDNETCQGLSPTRALGQSGEPLAFITAFENAQVAVIDTVSRALVSLIDVGNGPEGVAFSRDGQKAYVTNVSSGNVSYIDIATRELERTVTTGTPGTAPRGIAVSPDHSRLYVANSGTNAVAVIDRAAGTVVSAVPVGNGPFGLAITPNGATVITANTIGNSASFVSTATNALLGTIPVGTQPYGVATSPDGSLVYVANFASNSVSVIDVATRTVIDTITVGLGPFGIAVSSDGTRLYVSDNQNRVSVVDAVARQSIGSIPVGSHPQGVALTPDDKYLFVANQFSDSVDVIDTATKTVVFTRAVPSDPVSLGAFISPPLVRARQAVEFYHAFFGHYFVTIQEDEIEALDTGVFVGWARTGQTFNVFDLGSGYADVCRFFTTAFPPKSSHFYTPLAFECDLVKQNPDWVYEKIAFQLRLPEAGACPSGTIPLYRLYNNGLTGAPNHRYTTSSTIRAQMVTQGYIPEDDNTGCVPP
jgi:YVTN family beta-propeller protein